MIQNKKNTSHRIISLFALILIFTIVATTMTSCSKKIGNIEKDQTTEQYVASIVAQNEEHKLRFIAASRGHDISDYYSDDKNVREAFVDPEGIKPANVETAQKILNEIIETSKFKSWESRQLVVDFSENLTAENVTAVADELKTEVNLTVENGIFAVLLSGIGKALGWITRLVGNYYIVAILIFAVLVELIMIPVSIKQQKNSIGMAKLAPKMMRIEKKYAGRTDQATLRKKEEERMQLQQNEGYSPMSGCLPMILQLVIVGFILYPIVQNPLRYVLGTSEAYSSALLSYATSPKAVGGLGLSINQKGGVIELLSVLNSENIKGIVNFGLISNGAECLEIFNSLSIPNFTMFTMNLAIVPRLTFAWPVVLLLLIPILNVTATVLSMKLNKKWMATPQPTAADAQTKASMNVLEWVGPLMTLWIMFQVPALIGVYWLFRSLLSMGKQFILKTAMPVPQYTEEELREMEREEKERQKAQKNAAKAQPKYRSLHYIDDDDYEVLPDAPTGTDSKKNSSVDIEIPEIKD